MLIWYTRDMHIIQRNILAQLIQCDDCRFSELKPSELESNQFMYHLKVVQREGLVEKLESGRYRLTTQGKLHVDQLSLTSFKRRLQPKIVTLLACRNQNGEWLTLERRNQPLRGQIGFPYGKLHIGEGIEAAAHRELFEKTGLHADLTHRGDGYITMHESGQIISQVFFHLFYGEDIQGELRPNSRYGQVAWQPVDTDFSQAPFMASMPDLIKQIENSPEKRFFVELEYS